jgi:hypothetical protein
MPVYVALWATDTMLGRFDDKKDTKKLNEILELIQSKGGKILDVKVSLGGKENRVSAVYLILYEANIPLYP